MMSGGSGEWIGTGGQRVLGRADRGTAEARMNE